MKHIFFLLFVPVIAYSQVNPADVTIARDSFGVPHVMGKTDADAVYGLAWAHAEDNFKDIRYVLLTGNGMPGKDYMAAITVSLCIITLGELQKHIRGNKVYPSWGLPDVLTAMHSDSLADGRYKVRAGESYIELVRFPTGSLPVIESINCYGASANPASKHYTDQMGLFMQKKTRRMSLRKEDVLAQAEKIYHPG